MSESLKKGSNMSKIPFIFFLFLISHKVIAEGGYIATGVEIIEISNTGANGMSFTLKVANGDSNRVCENSTITFPLSVAGNAGNNKQIHARAFSLAMMAFVTGKRVSIYSYEDNTVCNRAAYINLYNG